MTLSEWYSYNLPFGCWRAWVGPNVLLDNYALTTDTDPRKFYDDQNRMWLAVFSLWLKDLVSTNRQFIRGWTRNRADWRFKARTDGKAMWNKLALP